MNICEALRILKLNGGHIYRDKSDPVEIHWWDSDSWCDFEQCRVTLKIGDLVAIDWKWKSTNDDYIPV